MSPPLVNITDVRKASAPRGAQGRIDGGGARRRRRHHRPLGSGKSTLLRCINGLETYQSGSITVDSMRSAAARQTCATCGATSAWCFSSSTVSALDRRQNVMLPRRWSTRHARRIEGPGAGPARKVGLADKFDSYPSQLSGGQHQRVAIARALAMRPSVLLCDEITSALDPELVNEVLKVVEQLAAEGITLMLVTHEMRFAREVGTKLVFMYQGRVHEEGPPKALFSAPKTPELAQFVGSIS